jgi:hypothetical protein
LGDRAGVSPGTTAFARHGGLEGEWPKMGGTANPEAREGGPVRGDSAQLGLKSRVHSRPTLFLENELICTSRINWGGGGSCPVRKHLGTQKGHGNPQTCSDHPSPFYLQGAQKTPPEKELPSTGTKVHWGLDRQTPVASASSCPRSGSARRKVTTSDNRSQAVAFPSIQHWELSLFLRSIPE